MEPYLIVVLCNIVHSTVIFFVCSIRTCSKKTNIYIYTHAQFLYIYIYIYQKTKLGHFTIYLRMEEKEGGDIKRRIIS